MGDRGCGAYIGSDPSDVPLYCGTVRAALCARCKNSRAGSDTREDSGLRGDEGVDGLGSVEGFTPALEPDNGPSTNVDTDGNIGSPREVDGA